MSRFTTSGGNYYTRQLFWEESITLPIEKRMIKPFFTLYKDRPNTLNFGKAYIKSKDPTGYTVAQELLDGDYTLWTVLMGCRWFLAAKEVWDRELDAALSSEGLKAIREMAEDGMPAQKLAAAKYLANKEYRKDKTANKGRPKREEVDRAARELAANEKDIQADLDRIKGTGS
jgi:hypothetical protein